MNAVRHAIEERLSGGRPSPLRALLSAVAAGFVAAGLVYRLLRR